MLAGLSLRAWVMIGLLAGAAFVVGLIYNAGGQAERSKTAVRDAAAAVGAAGANQKGAEAVANSNDEFARTAARFQREVADAREDILHFRGLIEEGRAGPETPIDRAYGQRVLCRLERVRDDPASPGCRAAPADADAEPAGGR